MNIYLGSRLLVSKPLWPGEEARMSAAFFCSHCGEVWGRAVRGPLWYAIQRPCERHADAYHIGGSFFQNYDWNDFPFKASLMAYPSLAVHEFRCHMAWAEKFLAADLPTFQGELTL